MTAPTPTPAPTPTADDVVPTILASLRAIAPEVDPAAIAPRTPLRDQLDLDSMDYLRLFEALAARYRLDFPEADLANLHTLDDIAVYIRSRAPAC